jgi:serine/threonine protein kinase
MQGGSNSAAGVSEGDILAGNLGAGGMGVVVAAHHVQLDDKVALKFLLPEMLSPCWLLRRSGRNIAFHVSGKHPPKKSK